jgi:hypothetical protein
MNNIAYIDGQNLRLGTVADGWTTDHLKFRTYLREKYAVTEAYYMLGFITDTQQDLYTNLQRAGFILEFREHGESLVGKKKGNVDSDIVFSVMRKLVENELFDKAYIVSGDGDYRKVVDYLIKKNKFGKMLFPNKQFASSLYKKIGGEYFDYLGATHIRSKIEYSNK